MKINSPNIYHLSAQSRAARQKYSSVQISFMGKKERQRYDEIIQIKKNVDFQTRMNELHTNMLKQRMPLESYINDSINIMVDCAKGFDPDLERILKKWGARKNLKRAVKEFCSYASIDRTDKNVYNFMLTTGYINLFTSSSKLAVMASSVLLGAKNYSDALSLAKIRDLDEKEKEIRAKIAQQEKILKAKEFVSDNFIQPVLILSDNPELKLPNAIMIESDNADAALDIINWLLARVSCNKIVVSNDDDSPNTLIKNRLKSALEQSQQNHTDGGIPTLIYCEHFEKLLLSENPDIEKASIKALLSNVFSKYGATIIFSSQDSSKIDNVIKQPHRIKSFDIDNND